MYGFDHRLLHFLAESGPWGSNATMNGIDLRLLHLLAESGPWGSNATMYGFDHGYFTS
jgi:sulfur relay (sulfurtransferase) DsrF/TusC family protein